MAFHIGYQGGLAPAAALVVAPVEVGAEAHAGFGIIVVGIAPEVETGIGKGRFFVVVGKMLEDEHGIRIVGADAVFDAVPDRDAAGVVTAPGGYIAEGVHLREALAEVETESVHIVFLQPVFNHPVHIIFCGLRFMVEVVSNIEVVFGRDVQPRIVGRGLVAGRIPIQMAEAALAKGVVQHDVEDHRHAVFVAFIHQRLQLLAVAVVFVQRHVVGAVVTPAGIAFKLAERHEFDGVDAQAAQIGEGVADGIEMMAAHEIADMQFVDVQLRRIAQAEAVVLPVVNGMPGPQHRNQSVRFTGWISRQIREVGLVDPGVVPGVEYEFAERIGNLQRAVYKVLVSVLFSFLQPLDIQPPAQPVGCAFHGVSGIGKPVVEVAGNEDRLLARGVQGEAHAVVAQIGGTVAGIGWERSRDSLAAGEINERIRHAAGACGGLEDEAVLPRREGSEEGVETFALT